MRILVAEDDRGLREVLVQGLQDAGYVVDAVDRGDDAIEQLKFYAYDVAIVDWRMPGVPGVEVVSWARKHDRPTAILMLTARDTTPDRIQGLDAGADDYLVKPFDFGELVARVRALQRRPRGVDAPVMVKGGLSLDPARRQASVNGRPLNLTTAEFHIVELLMRRFPAVVDRKAIAEQPSGEARQLRGPDRYGSRSGVPPRRVRVAHLGSPRASRRMRASPRCDTHTPPFPQGEGDSSPGTDREGD